MLFLLLRAGDIESNPGPNTRSTSSLLPESLPADPSEQMQAVFNILKDIQVRSVESSKIQADLATDLKEIKTSQKKIEEKIGSIEKRLDALEEKTKTVDHLEQDMTTIQASVETLGTQHESIQARLDELEDRSRRNNLIFHGLPDAKETWEQSEQRITQLLSDATINLADHDIERAHRLGAYKESKSRPIIVKFSNYKTKDKILSARTKLKELNVAVTEDFSPATRQARGKLVAFAKSQPGSPQFKLHHTKLIIDKKHYTYDPFTDSINELKLQQKDNQVLSHPTPTRAVT